MGGSANYAAQGQSASISTSASRNDFSYRPMCRYLHHNDLGCISRCPTGCCLHLYFGNVALCLNRAELPEWRTAVAQLYEQHVHILPDPQGRCLVLPGPVAYQKFVFTLEEVLLLHDLLMGASLLLEVEALLATAAN